MTSSPLPQPPTAVATTPPSPIKRSKTWLFFQSLTWFVYKVLFRYEAYGLHNIPPTGGAILAANHESFLDPPLVGASLTRPVSFMAKSELFEKKYFGFLIRNLHAFPIRQGKGDRAAIVETVKRLQEGHLLNMYPEGSRSEDGKLAPFQTGIGLLIRKAEVPVIPVAIVGSYEAWPKGRKIFRPGHLRVMYGPPLTLHTLPAAEAIAKLERVIRVMIEDLRAWPSSTPGEPPTALKSPE